MLGGAVAWWTELYRGHDVVQFLAGLGHILTIVFAGRYALAGDRAALRAQRRPPAQRDALLRSIVSMHRPVLLGLSLALLTGLAQLLAQLDYLPGSFWFWAKLTGLALLLANGRVIMLASRSLRADPEQPARWRTLRAAAVRSLVLWTSLVIIGLMMTTVRP
ncbi:MAG TPA: hypothetical protein VK939_04460 [Longimicrobiales bacterium]|nr:hypothetical protein [Longimicrobiales bacterium]